MQVSLQLKLSRAHPAHSRLHLGLRARVVDPIWDRGFPHSEAAEQVGRELVDADGAVREEQELEVVGAGGVGRGLCGYEEYGAEPASAVMDAVFLKAQGGHRGGGIGVRDDGEARHLPDEQEVARMQSRRQHLYSGFRLRRCNLRAGFVVGR